MSVCNLRMIRDAKDNLLTTGLSEAAGYTLEFHAFGNHDSVDLDAGNARRFARWIIGFMASQWSIQDRLEGVVSDHRIDIGDKWLELSQLNEEFSVSLTLSDQLYWYQCEMPFAELAFILKEVVDYYGFTKQSLYE